MNRGLLIQASWNRFQPISLLEKVEPFIGQSGEFVQRFIELGQFGKDPFNVVTVGGQIDFFFVADSATPPDRFAQT